MTLLFSSLSRPSLDVHNDGAVNITASTVRLGITVMRIQKMPWKMNWRLLIANAFAVCATMPAFPPHLGAQNLNPTNVINLRCDGTARVSKGGHGGWPEQVERISIGFAIDQSSGKATISGLPLVSRLYDTSPVVFEVTENTFSWFRKVREGSKEFTSSIEIDRYSTTMEAGDFVMDSEPGKEYIWSKSVRAACKRFVDRAF